MKQQRDSATMGALTYFPDRRRAAMIATDYTGLHMAGQPRAPITVYVAKEMIADIDALAAAMYRSRNYVVVQALEQYLRSNAFRIARIREGITAARDGLVVPADDVFAGIATRHGWTD